MKEKLLLHTCCAPCMVDCIDVLRELDEYDVTSFWYNHNIHPKVEYEARKNTLIDYCKQIDLPLVVEESYGMEDFIKTVVKEEYNEKGIRCKMCYTKRMRETFRYAKENGFDAVCTTLLISPYQKHDLIKEICEELAKEYGVKFYYYDFRPGFRRGQNKAREIGLYRQKFCGCVYSIDSGKWCR